MAAPPPRGLAPAPYARAPVAGPMADDPRNPASRPASSYGYLPAAPPPSANPTQPTDPNEFNRGGTGVNTTRDAARAMGTELGVDYRPAAGSSKYGTTTGLNSSLLGSRNEWANDGSGNKPWLSRGESTLDTRNNFSYGGTATGAVDMNNRIAAYQDQANNQLNGLGVSAMQGQQMSQADQYGAQVAGVNAANRDPRAFISNRAVTDNAQGRGAQMGAYNALDQFAANGPGPSAAQAQLNQATDANMANSLAMARSGRGMGQSQAALGQAMAQNAGIGQQAANQSAVLRAQEVQDWQGKQLNAYGQMGNIAGQARQGDVQQGSYMSGTQQAASSANDQTALGYGQQALGYGNLGFNYGNQALGVEQARGGVNQGYLGQQNAVNTTQLQGGQAYEQNVQNYYENREARNASGGNDYTPYVAAGAAILGAATTAYTGSPQAGAAVSGATNGVGNAATR